MQVSKPEVSNLRTLLTREHARLEELFDELLAAANGDARVECARLWAEFDERLQAHLRLEEQHILPAFAREHAVEAERIAADHAEIRKLLLQLGVGVDLHLVRAEAIDRFIASLRTHAAREDQLLYAWAQEHLRTEAQRTLLERLLSHLQHQPSASQARANR